MKFSSLSLYKLTQTEGAIVITDQHDGVARRDAVPLVICDGATMVQYLERYLRAREAGRDALGAHADAMVGAKIVKGLNS